MTTTDDRPETRVRARRKELELKQEELAEQVGCDQTTISGIETGLYGPSLRLAIALANVLATTVEELFGEVVSQ